MPVSPSPDRGGLPQPEAAPSGSRREVDFVLPLATAICVVLGWFVVLDYERTVLDLAGQVQATALIGRIWNLRLMMAFGSVGGLGLAWLAARDSRGRRAAERELKRVNAELARRVVRRTAELRARTKALRESQLREQLREKEAEVAYQAGLVEAAGQYLHDVGNALSSLELELLRLRKATDGADRLQAAFDSLAQDLGTGRTEEAGQLLVALREAVLGRSFPRVEASQIALDEIMARMAGELERRRDEFERPGQPTRYLQTFRVDLELAAMLDRLPRAAGSDPVVRDIETPVAVHNRKHPFLAGLATLLRQELELTSDRVTVRLRLGSDNRAVITVEGVGEEGLFGPAVAAFINFLNENNGVLRFETASNDLPSRLVVEIGDANPAPPLP